MPPSSWITVVRHNFRLPWQPPSWVFVTIGFSSLLSVFEIGVAASPPISVKIGQVVKNCSLCNLSRLDGSCWRNLYTRTFKLFKRWGFYIKFLQQQPLTARLNNKSFSSIDEFSDRMHSLRDAGAVFGTRMRRKGPLTARRAFPECSSHMLRRKLITLRRSITLDSSVCK